MEAMTVHMMAVASMMYCAAAAPPGLLGTLNGVVGSVHYSFGNVVSICDDTELHDDIKNKSATAVICPKATIVHPQTF